MRRLQKVRAVARAEGAQVAHLLQPPLHSHRAAFPTVYTAVYRPAEGRVDYVWPDKAWPQAIGAFSPGEYVHDYGELGP